MTAEPPVAGPGRPGWVDAYLAAQDDRPEVEGADGVVTVMIDGGRKSKVVFTERLVGGRVVSVQDGPAPGGGDLELVVPADLAGAFYSGAVDPAVAFMQGKLKVAGDQALWWRLVAQIGDPGYRAALARAVGA